MIIHVIEARQDENDKMNKEDTANA